MTWSNVQPPCNTCVHCAQSSQDHRNHQCSTILHATYLHSQVAVLRQLLSMFLANVAISRTADINKKTRVCLLISKTDVWMIGFDLPGSGDGGICLHKLIKIIPVQSALQWKLKMATNIPVNDGGHLIVLITAVYQCQSTTACHNVLNCFQAYTAHVASKTDITIEQQQPVPQLKQKDSLPLAIRRSLSCPQAVAH